jgi:GNAT superfamily N-acetyltransferase
MGENLDFKGITVRKLDKRKLHKEIEIYTYLNNACFLDHPFWAERNVQEDFELFHPFRFLIKEENLLFAEKDGKPIGFFLWYPDFNQLLKGHQHLGIKHVLQYYFTRRIDTFRFTEIAVLPEYKLSHAAQALILYAIPYIRKAGIKYGEGGFIFEENKNSIAMTRRFLERATGIKMEPHRHFALFETTL